MYPTQPRSTVSVLGLIKMLAGTLAASALLAMGGYAISHIIYLIFLFPAIMGGIAGVALTDTIKRARVRNRQVVIVCAILIGILTWGGMRLGRYLEFRSTTESQLVNDPNDPYTPAEAQQAINFFLQDATGFSGFPGHIVLTAQRGMSTSSLFSSTADRHGSIPTILYWLSEIALIAGLSSVIALDATKKPFCELHQRWLEPSKHLGGVVVNQGQLLLDYVKGHDFKKAGLLIQEISSWPTIDLYVESCPKCDYMSHTLTVQRNDLGPKGNLVSKVLLKEQISRDDFRTLQQAITLTS